MKRIIAGLATFAVVMLVGMQGASANQAGDTSPFYGGSQLGTWVIGTDGLPYWQNMSAGFMLSDGTYTYGLSAGHAGGPGSIFYAGNPTTGYTYWGKVQQRSMVVDANVAPVADARDYVWIADANIRTVYNWETTNQDNIGGHICTSGASTGHETCGATIVQTGQPWGTGHDGVVYQCPGTANCSTGGDSGSPVYALFTSGPHAGQVEAVGIDVGGDGYSGGAYYGEYIPIRYIMSWVWTFNRHTNLLCIVCSPEP